MTLTELVDLPDPAVQPLVHPVDVPEARRRLRASVLIETFANPTAGILVAATVWLVTRSPVAAFLAAAAIIGFGWLAARAHRDRAWAFIPRKRQDRRRPLPVLWELGGGMVLATLLAAFLVVMSYRLAESGLAQGTREYIIGSGAVAALLFFADLALGLVRRRGADRIRVLLSLPAMFAVLTGLFVGYTVLLPGGLTATSLVGAATMLAVGAGVRLWRQVAARPGGRVQEVSGRRTAAPARARGARSTVHNGHR